LYAYAVGELDHEPVVAVRTCPWIVVPETAGGDVLVGGEGTVPVAAVTYAEIGHVCHDPPLLQDVGNELRVDCAEVWLEHGPEGRSRKEIVPPVPSTASQYVRPETTDTPPTAIEFQAPVASEERAPCVSREPGRPFTLE
jgi:hypothetical protein